MTDQEYDEMRAKLNIQASAITHKCEGCGIKLVFSGTDNMCGVCRENERKDRFNELAAEQRSLKNDPKLKVFQIIMYTQRKRSELVTDTIIVLASTEEKAISEAFAECGYTHEYKVKDEHYHIWEIDGPFIEGSILYRTPQ